MSVGSVRLGLGVGIENVRKRRQQIRAIAVPSAAVHAGERVGFQSCEPPQQSLCLLCVGVEIPQLASKGIARPENVTLEKRRMIGSAIGEKITAQQRPGRMLDDEARFRKTSPAEEKAAELAPGGPHLLDGHRLTGLYRKQP